MFKFSLAQLLLGTTIVAIASALLAWRSALGVVLLGIAGGLVMWCVGYLRDRVGLARWGTVITACFLAVLLYDIVFQVKWIGTCGFTTPLVVVDATNGKPVEGAEAAIVCSKPPFEFFEPEDTAITDAAGLARITTLFCCSGSRSGLGLTDSREPHSRPPLSNYVVLIKSNHYDRLEVRLDRLAANLSWNPATEVDLPAIAIKLEPLPEP